MNLINIFLNKGKLRQKKKKTPPELIQKPVEDLQF